MHTVCDYVISLHGHHTLVIVHFNHSIETGFFSLVLREFESLLSKQAPLEAFVEWIDSLIDRFVLKVSHKMRMKITDKSTADYSLVEVRGPSSFSYVLKHENSTNILFHQVLHDGIKVKSLTFTTQGYFL